MRSLRVVIIHCLVHVQVEFIVTDEVAYVAIIFLEPPETGFRVAVQQYTQMHTYRNVVNDFSW